MVTTIEKPRLSNEDCTRPQDRHVTRTSAVLTPNVQNSWRQKDAETAVCPAKSPCDVDNGQICDTTSCIHSYLCALTQAYPTNFCNAVASAKHTSS